METLIMVLTIVGLSILAIGGFILVFQSIQDYIEEKKQN